MSRLNELVTDKKTKKLTKKKKTKFLGDLNTDKRGRMQGTGCTHRLSSEA